MAAPLPVRIAGCSSEEVPGSVQDLILCDQNCAGWSTERSCSYPQELVLALPSLCLVQELRLLSHESRVASKVEVLAATDEEWHDEKDADSGDAAVGGWAGRVTDPPTLSPLVWRRLGYFSFEVQAAPAPGARRARELKTVALPRRTVTSAIKLVFHRVVRSAENPHEQAGLVYVQAVGERVERTAAAGARGGLPSAAGGAGAHQSAADAAPLPQGQGTAAEAGDGATPPSSATSRRRWGVADPEATFHPAAQVATREVARASDEAGSEHAPAAAAFALLELGPRPGATSGVDTRRAPRSSPPGPVGVMVGLDPETAAQLQALEAAKAEAVVAEDYDEAKRLKLRVDRLRLLAAELAALERAKAEAVRVEDYDEAKRLKGMIAAIRTGRGSAAAASAAAAPFSAGGPDQPPCSPSHEDRPIRASGSYGRDTSTDGRDAEGSGRPRDSPSSDPPPTSTSDGAWGPPPPRPEWGGGEDGRDLADDGLAGDERGGHDWAGGGRAEGDPIAPPASDGRGPPRRAFLKKGAGRSGTSSPVRRGAGDVPSSPALAARARGGVGGPSDAAAFSAGPAPPGWPPELDLPEAVVGEGRQVEHDTLEPIIGGFLAACAVSGKWQLRATAAKWLADALAGEGERQGGGAPGVWPPALVRPSLAPELTRHLVPLLRDKVAAVVLGVIAAATEAGKASLRGGGAGGTGARGPGERASAEGGSAARGSPRGTAASSALSLLLPSLLDLAGDGNARVREAAAEGLAALAACRPSVGLRDVAWSLTRGPSAKTAANPRAASARLKVLTDLLPALAAVPEGGGRRGGADATAGSLGSPRGSQAGLAPTAFAALAAPGLAHPNAAVRQAATSLLVALASWCGPGLDALALLPSSANPKLRAAVEEGIAAAERGGRSGLASAARTPRRTTSREEGWGGGSASATPGLRHAGGAPTSEGSARARRTFASPASASGPTRADRGGRDHSDPPSDDEGPPRVGHVKAGALRSTPVGSHAGRGGSRQPQEEGRESAGPWEAGKPGSRRPSRGDEVAPRSGHPANLPGPPSTVPPSPLDDLPLFLDELESRRRRFGEKHPAVADALGSVAMLLNQRGRTGEAMEAYLAAARAWEACEGGKTHPGYAAVLTDLAVLHLEAGRDEVGRPLLERALEIQGGLLGEDHPDVVAMRDVLAESI